MVDIGLEQGSGVELARRLAQDDPELGVLIYTGLGDGELLREALHSGARGSALKSGPARDLVAAALAVAAGAATSTLTSRPSSMGPGRPRSPCCRPVNVR